MRTTFSQDMLVLTAGLRESDKNKSQDRAIAHRTSE